MADNSDRTAAGDAPADDRSDDADDAASPESRSTAPDATNRGPPEVVVPMDLYKTVTVFSTLLAISMVVGGMIALDVATGRATRDLEDVTLPIAFLGIASIVGGAAVYAFAARFRAEGMGNPKDANDEG